MKTNVGRGTLDQNRIVMEKAAFDKKKALFTSKVYYN
jgi:hypothetical protein